MLVPQKFGPKSAHYPQQITVSLNLKVRKTLRASRFGSLAFLTVLLIRFIFFFFFLPKLAGLLLPKSTRRVDTAKHPPVDHPHPPEIYRGGERALVSQSPTPPHTHSQTRGPPSSSDPKRALHKPSFMNRNTSPGPAARGAATSAWADLQAPGPPHPPPSRGPRLRGELGASSVWVKIHGFLHPK